MERKKSKYDQLKSKWGVKHTKSKQHVWSNHTRSLKWALENIHPRQLIAGSLGGLMLLHVPASYLSAMPNHPAPVVVQAAPVVKTNQVTVVQPIHTVDTLKSDIAPYIPASENALTPEQEDILTRTLSSYFDCNVRVEINGIRMNTNYGIIGAEQHLMLYPGDTMDTHFQEPSDALSYSGSGMAPGRGAWGYFADSRADLTQEDIQREKYYIAIQTFLSPGYADNVQAYYNFFKYRKVLVVNPDNGKAIVADIGDAGPSPFTGKQLGGSPEVMSYLQRVDGMQRGHVLYFFIDDQNNTIPLGPISISH